MSDPLLALRFSRKMSLPTELEIRCCSSDNFLFSAAGDQKNYDEHYRSLANDSIHAELSEGSSRSPISRLQREYLVQALNGFLDRNRKVLDFGCGEACLLVELASDFPSSTFFGFDPGPAAQIGSNKAAALRLDNLLILDQAVIAEHGPYDLVIASHVVEHLIDFDLLSYWKSLLTENGLLYIEVPDSLQYETRKRQEFLYYFDRLHVNHFTPQSLARLAVDYGFGYLQHFEYSFPYRQGDAYPALGMLLQKGSKQLGISSPCLADASERYISLEKQRAERIAATFDSCDEILVWGAGDNFHRSIENGGPLSTVRKMVVLDRRPQEIVVGGRTYATEEPLDAIQRYPWPVVITVSEGRKSMTDEVIKIDPSRRIFFV
jgi:hypothetical protein